LSKEVFNRGHISIFHGNVFDFYDQWATPIVIISDGPYGISGFPGDPPSHEELAEWYEPHIKKWSEKSSPETTLWFWNTEVGWATVHPVLVKYGWKYRSCHIWDKGMGHVAGNVNGKSMRKLPVVTEVCVQYVKEPIFHVEGKKLLMKEWLRYEWGRTGIPFSKTNEACGVIDAATRKYFTKCHLWYFPPAEAFEKIQKYANAHGKKAGRPYFSIDGENPITKESWEKMRAKFNFIHGVTNVWPEPPVNGKERLKSGLKSIHLNQKPLRLTKMLVELSSDEGDLIWEPFGGLCTGMVSAELLNRVGVAAEISKEIYEHAVNRLKQATEVPLPL